LDLDSFIKDNIRIAKDTGRKLRDYPKKENSPKKEKKQNPKKLGLIEGWKLAGEGYKLMVDFTLKSFAAGDDMKFIPLYRLTKDPVATLISKGYRESEGLVTKLAYYRMPVYVKFNNFKKCDFRKGFVDELGRIVKNPEDGQYAVP
jgi:hypothetical protein